MIGRVQEGKQLDGPIRGSEADVEDILSPGESHMIDYYSKSVVNLGTVSNKEPTSRSEKGHESETGKEPIHGHLAAYLVAGRRRARGQTMRCLGLGGGARGAQRSPGVKWMVGCHVLGGEAEIVLGPTSMCFLVRSSRDIRRRGVPILDATYVAYNLSAGISDIHVTTDDVSWEPRRTQKK